MFLLAATGQLIFHIFGALAEFERNLIRERTIAGLEAARARGRLGGRPELSGTSSKVTMAKKLYADKTNAIKDICKTLHISRATLYRYIQVTHQRRMGKFCLLLVVGNRENKQLRDGMSCISPAEARA